MPDVAADKVLTMADTVKLMGLDFGTTTSSAVIAEAQLRRTASGRVELDCQEEIYRSELVFTPLLDDDRLDLAQVERLLEGWLEAGRVKAGELFGGGALLCGCARDQIAEGDPIIRHGILDGRFGVLAAVGDVQGQGRKLRLKSRLG